MSGEPTPRSIILWTRVADVERSGTVRLEVATDQGFNRVVTSRLIGTNGDIDHTVKARITGLRPDERYYYRFETASRQSRIGRFKTAPPADSNQPVRFAFFSCAEFTHGYFNAYAAMADEDLDFVVNLGDYIYEKPIDVNSPLGPWTAVRTRFGRRGAHGPAVPAEVPPVPLRPGTARDAPPVPARLDLGRPRGRGQLRGWRSDQRGLGSRTAVGRATARGSSSCRSGRCRRAAAGSIAACASGGTSTC